MSYLKVSKACKMLDVSRTTLMRYIRKGWLRADRLPSGQWRVEEESLRHLFSFDHKVDKIVEGLL